MSSLRSKLDPHLLRTPFEGRRARRYARRERCGFGDLDERLARLLDAELSAARVLLDLGAGPCDLARRLAREHPGLRVVAVEPSATYTHEQAGSGAGVSLLRARGEALPLAADSVDLALCLSSIRHVRDRGAALGELRRVVRPGGSALVVELDPSATQRRVRAHRRGLRSALARLLFAPLVLRTAPPAEAVARAARAAGWTRADLEADPQQPVYLLRLE